jgi:hypothetical protein
MARSNVAAGAGSTAESLALIAASSKAQMAAGDAQTKAGVEMDLSAAQNSAAKQMSLAGRTAQEANATNSKGASDMMKSGAG